jgi:phosphoribosyl 1,2-cyclic phosphodiesterase
MYVESHGAALLVDQGITHRKLVTRLKERDLDPGKVRAILVSHEHSDHVSGVGVTSRALGVPIYATAGSHANMQNLLDGTETVVIIESGVPFSIGPLEVHPFSVPHDATEPVQYCIRSGAKKIAIATDIGFASTLVVERIKDADILVIEANYDVEMLKKGSYPWQLKQRIMGKTGHLSNRNTSELLFNIIRDGSTKIVLAHLSEENNHPEIAIRTVQELFDKYERSIGCLIAASQYEATPVLDA